MEELVFLKLKQTLAQGLALALPNVTKQFYLYTCETQGIAKNILTQTLKPWPLVVFPLTSPAGKPKPKTPVAKNLYLPASGNIY